MSQVHNIVDTKNFIALGQAVVETEAAAIKQLLAKIDAHFARACEHLLACQGRIVVLGMGKSGHIGNKIAATLASTGSPAFFVHPGEASHGDMGMITKQDVVIAISNSGNTAEIALLLPLIKRLNVPLIALTGRMQSPLAEAATVALDVSVHQEACPLGLAPTSSTTAALVMGDALAIALLQARGFTAEDFALSHPGGALGRRLLLHTYDVMRTEAAIPQVSPSTHLSEALLVISAKGLGMTAVVDERRQVLGVFTDGDLRRAIDKNLDIHHTTMQDCMTTQYKKITPQTLAIDALNLMEAHKITALLVIDAQQQLVGVVHLHDLLRAGVV
jgi:arabinose-5-phosphate isomerase